MDHQMCLEIEVLTELAASITGFVTRNYEYDNIPVPQDVGKKEERTFEIDRKLLSAPDMDTLKRYEKELVDIRDYVKNATPLPHK